MKQSWYRQLDSNVIYYVLSDELTKLMSMEFGQFIDKEKMAADKLFPTKNCFSAFIKKDLTKLQEDNLENEFFQVSMGQRM